MNAETLRNICLQLPSVTEEIKWGHDLVFSIGGKMFCVTSFDEPFKASFKVPDESFEELCYREGIIPAPYLARARWVQVTNDAGFSKAEWQHFIAQAHQLIAAKLTKKQKSELGIQP